MLVAMLSNAMLYRKSQTQLKCAHDFILRAPSFSDHLWNIPKIYFITSNLYNSDHTRWFTQQHDYADTSLLAAVILCSMTDILIFIFLPNIMSYTVAALFYVARQARRQVGFEEQSSWIKKICNFSKRVYNFS